MITRAQFNALNRAVRRPRGNLCPMPVHAAAQTMLLRALVSKGLCSDDPAPTITDAGRAAHADYLCAALAKLPDYKWGT